MNNQDDRGRAAQDLMTIRAHQDRARRAARPPWWVYLAMFALTAAVTAVNDAVDLNGAKLLAGAVLAVLVVVLVITFAGRSAPLSGIRGVQREQSFIPSVFGVVVIVGALGGWLISRYGTGLADDVAGAVGLRSYPSTVAGVLLGAAFTGLYALTQALIARSERRRNG
jgi:hypothetical protein